ncbi:unnamed protein product [Rangifer tarandus platyrhynchus]|uniref:Uncharacterized protein n=2 Tax=Rangifer tarandus platyrhynchus TaxID=3082113 RepID=A0AC59YZ46_RANTA|nr:unnamed protein product [Rangifer tarandus platyrhynchus]
MCVLSRSVMSDCSPPGSSVHGDSPGKNTGVGSLTLLQEIFPTQGLNPGLLHCRLILYPLSHQGSPFIYISIYMIYTFSIYFIYIIHIFYINIYMSNETYILVAFKPENTKLF